MLNKIAWVIITKEFAKQILKSKCNSSKKSVKMKVILLIKFTNKKHWSNWNQLRARNFLFQGYLKILILMIIRIQWWSFSLLKKYLKVQQMHRYRHPLTPSNNQATITVPKSGRFFAHLMQQPHWKEPTPDASVRRRLFQPTSPVTNAKHVQPPTKQTDQKEEANALDLLLLLKSCNLEKHFTQLKAKNVDVKLLVQNNNTSDPPLTL